MLPEMYRSLPLQSECFRACSIGAPGDPPFEMVNVRRLQLWACRLIMTAVLIQPGYRVGLSGAIVCSQF